MKRNLVVVVLLLFAMAGCSAEEAAKPPVCDSWDAVQNTVDHIRHVNVSENGLSALRPYLTQLRTELNQLYTDAKSQFSEQADALKASVEQLAADLRVAKEAPSAINLAAVRTSVSSVRGTANTLHNAMISTC
ncbi:hypothetical protein [Actinoplanes regularis]|uniref:Lipoprotein n=1 Tax=Actinoplanes regularis TaxID=52697 RepID=A0A239HWD6_9ACTN|nr:hypothetical protein [Actinoplanes regularis]GIE91250.1 hypothetical protein Are01nite_77300 [Actinoplanes regularis]SNS85592.1 hypothetical protein SAMN06264365_12661 [Actinoplanes regularis]